MLVAELKQNGRTVALNGVPSHDFKTGSRGYFASFRAAGIDGEVGITASLSDDGKQLWVGALPAKNFKTGSSGYFTNGRVVVGDANCTIQVQAVNVGSKKGVAQPGVYQCQVQLTIIGSKKADDEAAAVKATIEQVKAQQAATKAELDSLRDKANQLKAARKAEKEQRREAARHAAHETQNAADVAALKS